jgi:acyl-CoA synthetase (AMP-forming)/AMP-acid ligase II
VVKSGGEWISSIALENTAAGHPKVSAAHNVRWAPSNFVPIQQQGSSCCTQRRHINADFHCKFKCSLGVSECHVVVPQVLEAAVIAIPDERWGERPLLIVVPQPHAAGEAGLTCTGQQPSRQPSSIQI